MSFCLHTGTNTVRTAVLLMQPWWQLILPTMHLNLRCGWNDGKSICYVYFVLFFVPNSELLGKNSTIIQWLNGYLLQGQDRKITFFCIRCSWWPTQVVQTVAHEHRVTSPLLGPHKWCNLRHMKTEWQAPRWAHRSGATTATWRESDMPPFGPTQVVHEERVMRPPAGPM